MLFEDRKITVVISTISNLPWNTNVINFKKKIWTGHTGLLCWKFEICLKHLSWETGIEDTTWGSGYRRKDCITMDTIEIRVCWFGLDATDSG